MHTLVYGDSRAPFDPKQRREFVTVRALMSAIHQLDYRYNIRATVRTPCGENLELSRMAGHAYVEVGRVLSDDQAKKESEDA